MRPVNSSESILLENGKNPPRSYAKCDTKTHQMAVEIEALRLKRYHSI